MCSSLGIIEPTVSWESPFLKTLEALCRKSFLSHIQLGIAGRQCIFFSRGSCWTKLQRFIETYLVLHNTWVFYSVPFPYIRGQAKTVTISFFLEWMFLCFCVNWVWKRNTLTDEIHKSSTFFSLDGLSNVFQHIPFTSLYNPGLSSQEKQQHICLRSNHKVAAGIMNLHLPGAKMREFDMGDHGLIPVWLILTMTTIVS